MQKLKISLIALFFSLLNTVNAQEQSPKPTKVNQPRTLQTDIQKSLNTGSIVSQFDYLSSTSNNYQDYKVIKKTSLEKLKNNVIDSLQSMQAKLMNINATLSTHDSEVASLQDSLAKTIQELKVTKEEKESVSFLGMLLSKSAYNTLVWSLISLLIVILIFYIYRFKQNHTITADAKKTLEEVRAEFEQHRKKAMEREQKLNRRLQDELNKRF